MNERLLPGLIPCDKIVLMHKALLLTIILIGFTLRLYRLGVQSLWYDETVSVFLAGQSVPDLIAHTARDIHPPAYYVLLHFWTNIAGNDEFALAFFSVFFGVLLLPLTYQLARYLGNKSAATWAALLVTFSPFNIWYSQEVRMYTLGALLGLIATICALRALVGANLAFAPQGTPLPRMIEKIPQPLAAIFRSSWPGYLIAAAIGLYTLYYFAFLLIVVNFLFLFYALYPTINRPALRSLVIVNCLLMASYLPWLPIAWRQAAHPPVPAWREFDAFSPWSIIYESWSALSVGQSVDPAAVWPILIAALLLFIGGLRYLSQNVRTQIELATSHVPRPTFHVLRSSRYHLIFSGPPHFAPFFLGSYVLGPLLIIYLSSLVTPLYHVRYVFIYSPAFYILVGAGLAWISARMRLGFALIVAGFLLVASLFSIYQLHFNPRYGADDYRAAVHFIQSRWQPGDVILINAGYIYPAFVYYCDFPTVVRRRLIPYRGPIAGTQSVLLQTGSLNGNSQLGWGDPNSDFYAMSAAETTTAFEKISKDFSRLWMLRAYDTVTDPTGLIRTWLAQHAIPLEDQVFSGESNIRAQGFLFPAQTHPPGPPIQFEDGLALLGWHLPAQGWQPGQTIQLKLWWQAIASPSLDYKMSLKLWTPAGKLAAQGQDEWPVGTLYRTSAWLTGQIIYHPTQLMLPPDLPAGQYWLDVELYHPETIERLPRLDGGAPRVTLGPVLVEH